MSFGSVASSVISTVAPMLGTALGGPLGGLAGNLLAKAFGAKQTDGSVIPAAVKDIEAALTGGSPETMLALKQAENELQEHMAQLGVTEDQLAYADTDSARKREETVKDHTPSILAYALTVGVIALVFCLFKLDIPAENKAVMFSVSGAVVSTWTLAMGYYFGSSVSSKGKTDALASLAAAKK